MSDVRSDCGSSHKIALRSRCSTCDSFRLESKWTGKVRIQNLQITKRVTSQGFGEIWVGKCAVTLKRSWVRRSQNKWRHSHCYCDGVALSSVLAWKTSCEVVVNNTADVRADVTARRGVSRKLARLFWSHRIDLSIVFSCFENKNSPLFSYFFYSSFVVVIVFHATLIAVLFFLIRRAPECDVAGVRWHSIKHLGRLKNRVETCWCRNRLKLSSIHARHFLVGGSPKICHVTPLKYHETVSIANEFWTRLPWSSSVEFIAQLQKKANSFLPFRIETVSWYIALTSLLPDVTLWHFEAIFSC